MPSDWLILIMRLTASNQRRAVCPDLAILCTLGNHSKLVATIILPKSPTLWGNFAKGVKIIHFLVKSFLGNFYVNLAIFIWSHWLSVKQRKRKIFTSVNQQRGIFTVTKKNKGPKRDIHRSTFLDLRTVACLVNKRTYPKGQFRLHGKSATESCISSERLEISYLCIDAVHCIFAADCI